MSESKRIFLTSRVAKKDVEAVQGKFKMKLEKKNSEILE